MPTQEVPTLMDLFDEEEKDSPPTEQHPFLASAVEPAHTQPWGASGSLRLRPDYGSRQATRHQTIERISRRVACAFLAGK